MKRWGGREARRLTTLCALVWGWVCYLCGEPIDPRVDRRTPLGLTAHHLLPQSKGGSHAIANLRPTHRVCNQRQGDKLGPSHVRRAEIGPGFSSA